MEKQQLPAIGEAFEGGFYAGDYRLNGDLYALIVAPKATGEKMDVQYKINGRSIFDGTASDDDGLANSNLINDENHPAAQFCRSLQVDGFDDWFLPSRDELAMLWRNMGPNRANTPDQFKNGAAEAFELDWYWSSTEYAPNSDAAWVVDFGNGGQDNYSKYYSDGVRAVRRFKL